MKVTYEGLFEKMDSAALGRYPLARLSAGEVEV
jgi:hypothetical protein